MPGHTAARRARRAQHHRGPRARATPNAHARTPHSCAGVSWCAMRQGPGRRAGGRCGVRCGPCGACTTVCCAALTPTPMVLVLVMATKHKHTQSMINDPRSIHIHQDIHHPPPHTPPHAPWHPSTIHHPSRQAEIKKLFSVYITLVVETEDTTQRQRICSLVLARVRYTVFYTLPANAQRFGRLRPPRAIAGSPPPPQPLPAGCRLPPVG